MAKELHLTRHAEAEHNVSKDWESMMPSVDLLTLVPDAKLTPAGQEQCRGLHTLTKETIQQTAQLIVCSPHTRTLESLFLGYPTLRARLEAEGKPVIILDILSEISAFPCDTPTFPPSAIASAQNGLFPSFDFTGLREGYASKKGIFDENNAEARAAMVRKWLAEREETEIVVVSHGDFLTQLVHGAVVEIPSLRWGNAEVKVFTFKEGSYELVEVVEV